MAKAEILAPCGSMESVYAAARCGADAVYLGIRQFSARANAENFSFGELKEAVRFLHARGITVHVALNTLMRDEELPKAVEALREVCRCGADAVIIQDLGFARLAEEFAPDIERHASTQMSVQTPTGFSLLERMGFETAVLPRELSESEIIEISERTTLRLEAFVHGALCMCVSGQCLFSAMLGGRSGNRGLCAQPCRLEFSAPGGTGHDLSLRDLSLIKRVSEIENCGVSLLKIEGRMKRPEYVAAAVSSLRSELDGERNEEIEKKLGAVFSRSGFTSGYFDGERGREMFGFRRKEDVLAADKDTLAGLRKLFEKEKPLYSVDFRFEAKRDLPMKLEAGCGEIRIEVQSESVPEAARTKSTDVSFVVEKLSKCGGTIFSAGDIAVSIEDGLSISAKEINALRRAALEKIEERLAFRDEKRFFESDLSFVSEKKNRKNERIVVRFASASQVPNSLDGVSELIFPLRSEDEFLSLGFDGKLVAEIPRGIFGMESEIRKSLEKAKEKGINAALCQTLDAVELAKEAGLEVFGGFGLNAFNSKSVEVLEELGVSSLVLSAELSLKQAGSIRSEIPFGVFAYGRLPLMLTRNCPIRNGLSCAECGKKSSLTDRKGVKFPVVCGGNCSEILNSVPIYLGDKKDDINADFSLLYFTVENDEEAMNALESYKKGNGFNSEFTRGLAYRGVI